jgi:hypothetical protein
MLREEPQLGFRRSRSLSAGLTLCTVLLLVTGTDPARSQVPSDRIHLSLSLGGYVMLGIGFTHWVEEHHAIEATLYPLGFPWDGFPSAAKLGYAWTPSDEVWRAKLGGNVTVLRHRHPGHSGGFTPVLAFTPGLQYDPTDQRSVRLDLWMSYYLLERVFAPTALEVIHAWK